MSPALGVLMTVAFVTTLMVSVAWLRGSVGLKPETARKIVHVGGGVLAMSFPWLFTNWHAVVAACGVNAVALAVTRYTNLFPRQFKDVLGGVDRGSGGEFYFPLAIALLFPLARGELALYLIPVFILTFSDTAAAIIGSRYGVTHYRASTGKSAEGSLAFFVVTLTLTYGLLALLTGLDHSNLLSLSIAVAVATTLTEAIATGGTDNLAVPLIAFLFLFASLGQTESAGWTQAGLPAMLGIALVDLQRRIPAFVGPGYTRRMRLYLSEMFPVPLRVVTAVAYYLGVASLVRLVLDLQTTLWTTYTLLGSWTLFFHMLVLRLMDELKDIEVDRELFPQRPVPSGRVRIGDIKSGLALASVLLVVPNMFVPGARWMVLALLAYSFLMFRFFFVPDLLRRHLLLNLATHNPVVVVVLLYLVALVGAEHGMTMADADWRLVLLLIAFYWPATFAWEIARKIRSREEEDAYVTYSQIFGRRGALLVVAGAQTMSLLVGTYLYLEFELSGLFLLVLITAYAAGQWGPVRFAICPGPGTSKLRPYAEGFVFGVLTSALVECLFGGNLNLA
ncbi:MAG: hypothetical protein JJE01_01045 [Gemmatimonadetes bacterium]|nr:hypothetical protein [Gemmatimonadota bacterium]